MTDPNQRPNPVEIAAQSGSRELDRSDREGPSRARWVVLAMLCSMSFVLYIDRVCMSQAIVPIGDDFGFTNWKKSLVMMAFTLAYGLFEVPTGRWGDMYGARRILTRIVIWWSVFTVATAMCFGFYSLLLVRFLFGAGEAGAYPNTARVIATWFPHRERGAAQGAFMAFSLVGGAVTPFLAAYMIEIMGGWRWPFVVFGVLGAAWAALFHTWFRDDPAEHSWVRPAELEWIRSGPAPSRAHDVAIPWGLLFQQRSLWLLGLIITCGAFNSYLYLSWYPNYLQKARGLTNVESGWLSSMVLAGGALGLQIGGIVGGRIVRRARNWSLARRMIGCCSYASAAVALLISVQFDSPTWSAGLAALSCACMFFHQSTWWSTTTDISGRHVGALFGLANGMGVIGAMGSQLFFGLFADWRAELGFTGRAQWDPAMYVVALVLVCGAATWLFVDPTRTIEGEAVEHYPATR
jgi:MFS family permease